MRKTPYLIGILFCAWTAAGCSSNKSPTTSTANLSQPQTRPSESAGGDTGGFLGIGNLWKNITGDTPKKYADMTLSDSADQRREGINGLVARDFGRKPPYTDRYKDMAETDRDPLVRATAIRALNVSRDKTATKLFVKALTSPDPQIRLEACKALHRVPDPDAAKPLLFLVTRPNEDKDVRIAAAEALAHYKNLEVARALVANLSHRDFGLAFQSRKSLKRLTGRDLLYDEAAWLAYLTGPAKPFG